MAQNQANRSSDVPQHTGEPSSFAPLSLAANLSNPPEIPSVPQENLQSYINALMRQQDERFNRLEDLLKQVLARLTQVIDQHATSTLPPQQPMLQGALPEGFPQNYQTQSLQRHPYLPPYPYPVPGYETSYAPPSFPSQMPYHSSTPWPTQPLNPASFSHLLLSGGGGAASSGFPNPFPAEAGASKPLFPQYDATKFPISDLGSGMGRMSSSEYMDSLMGDLTSSCFDPWLNADLSSLLSDLNKVISSTETSHHQLPWYAPISVSVSPALPSDKSPYSSTPYLLPVPLAADDKGKGVLSTSGTQSPELLPLPASFVDYAQNDDDSSPEGYTKDLSDIYSYSRFVHPTFPTTSGITLKHSGDPSMPKDDSQSRFKIPKSTMTRKRERTAQMTLKDLHEYMHLPKAEAARRIGISKRTLDNVCRRNGLNHWPYRNLKAMARLFEIMKEREASKPPPDP